MHRSLLHSRTLSRAAVPHVRNVGVARGVKAVAPLVHNRGLHHKAPVRALPPHHEIPTPTEPGTQGMLTTSALTHMINGGKIDTVTCAFPDIYGRLMGKRFDSEFFLESILRSGTHACDYLLACDMHMNPIPGFKFANWERGYGDFHLVPDLSTMRHTSWSPKNALVLCDIVDKDHKYLQYAPRSILRRQIERSKESGYDVLAASELEYYMYETSYRDAHRGDYTKGSVKPVSDYVEDYHILQGAREEKYNAEFRRHLRQSGVPVESSKSEAGIGQQELNIRYTDVLHMADRHTVYKQCLKEVSDQLGVSVTFMAKPYTDATGSGCHIHLSMVRDGNNAFTGNTDLDGIKCTPLFKQFLAGWLKYTPDFMLCYAPTVNSYKRFVSASWAPTRLAWSYDNRTAGYRVVGSGKSLRIECRIPGADVNVYLAFAASLASGWAGVRNKLEPPPLFQGDIYQARNIAEVPKSLHESIRLFETSPVVKEAFGEDVVQHYAHFFRKEQQDFDRSVTDWERKRYFEQI